ncbi:MAG TPA: 23S rRNA (uracil(1939)-C(5))-methyltransferase RlmD [Candidatus Methylomirabilis sp.]
MDRQDMDRQDAKIAKDDKAEAGAAAGPAVLRLAVTGLTFRGHGIARTAEGQVVFVPYAAPGDVVRARIVESRADYLRGVIERVEGASPDRVNPSCPHFGRCGGCQWLHVRDEAQGHWKAEILRDQLARLGGLRDVPIAPPVRPTGGLGYRTRAQLQVREAEGWTRFGFFAPASHQVVPVGTCPLLHPMLNEVLEGLAAQRTPPLGRLVPGLREVWLLASPRSGRSLLTLVGRRGERASLRHLFFVMRERVPHLAGLVLMGAGGADRSQAGRAEAAPRFLDRFGDGHLTMQPGAHRFRVDAAAFFQPSEAAAEALIAAVLELAAPEGGDRVVDLYCGVGTFAVPLAGRAARVVGVEGNPRAARDAEFNLQAAGAEGKARVLRMSVARAAASCAWGDGAEVVVADPPRQGLEGAVLDGVAGLQPRRIVYVSCDPSTLARDLKAFGRHGYQPKRIQPFDLFPQTYHIESVTLLETNEPS